jgi:hypothetical protein
MSGACLNLAIPSDFTRIPRNHLDGNIVLTAAGRNCQNVWPLGIANIPEPDASLMWDCPTQPLD